MEHDLSDLRGTNPDLTLRSKSTEVHEITPVYIGCQREQNQAKKFSSCLILM